MTDDEREAVRAAPESVRSEVARTQRLDAQLARDLGRQEPQRSSRGAADYVAGLGRRPTLPAASERELVRAAKQGDALAKARLVEAFMPMIASTARIYRTQHVQRVELLQEGVLGLLRALERFEPDRGVAFWTYAAWWVRQAMQQLVSELTRPVVLSDHALRQLAQLKQAHREVIQQQGAQPTRAQLAERSGLTREQVDDLLAAEARPRSFDEPIEAGDGEVGTFGDLLADPLAGDAYEEVLRAIEVAELHTLLAGLSDRERDVLRARYGLDGDEQTLREIGDRLGVSAERIRQIEQRALGKLASSTMTGSPAEVRS